MEESARARDALLRFYDAFTAAVPGDMATFDRVFTSEQALLIIGTAPHEWVEGRENATSAWGMEGVGLEAGDPEAWERGPVAWAADRPSFVFGETRMPIRIMAVMVEEDGEYRVATAHFSVGVPDDVAMENAAGWATAAPPH